MISAEDKQYLEELTGKLLHPDGLLESTYTEIDEILRKHPEEVAGFVQLFEDEAHAGHRHAMAMVIIEHQAHPGVIRYLRDELGWKQEDFWGTAAEDCWEGN